MFKKLFGFMKKDKKKEKAEKENLVDKIVDVVEETKDKIGESVEKPIKVVKKNSSEFVDKVEEFEEKVEEFTENSKEKVEEVVGSSKEKIEEFAKNSKEKAQEEVGSSKEKIEEFTENSKEKVEEVVGSSKEKIEKFVKNSKEKVEEVIETSKEKSKEFTENLNEKVEDIKEKNKKKGFFDRLKDGLFKTRDAMNLAIDNLINGKAKIDDDLYEELEEIMISADIGVTTTINIIDDLRKVIEDKHIRDPKLIKGELENLLKNNLRLKNKNNDLNITDDKATIILVIGVNGVGKTTTIGKLAYNLKKEGNDVLLAAADTFRAAAIEQLSEWSNRVDVELVSHSEGSDPASVVFDAIKSQKADNKKVLIIDTAGRLHNKKNLMNELEKINRIIDREYPEANKETLLVLDATTGQNAIFQAKEFNKVTDITGIVLTKLDGTAKGGVVFPLQVENNIPVKYIGIGEQKDNLEKFNSDKFVEALFTNK